MRARRVLYAAFLLSVVAVSAQPPFPSPEVSFRVRQLPMTGVRWAGPIGSLAVDPTDAGYILAASVSGGLFRSNGGGRWAHVDSLAPSDLSTVTWAPTFGLGTVFVSTRDDFRKERTLRPDGFTARIGFNTSGVWRSDDRGDTWRQVLQLRSGPLPGGVNCDTRPMAYGMSTDRIGRQIFVATKCGVWGSSTGERNEFGLYPGTATAANPALNRFYDVEALRSGDVVALGEAGLFTLAPGTALFVRTTTIPPGLDFGNLGSDGNYRGAFSSSPRGNRNVFAVVRSNSVGGNLVAPAILYSSDAGRNWQIVPGPASDVSGFRGGCGGAPFIRAVLTPLGDNPDAITLYYGDSCHLYKAGPLSPQLPSFNFGPILGSITWSRFTMAHDDTHDFVPFGSRNAMVATDGGIEVCRRDNSVPCGETIGPEHGLNALQVLGLGGQRILDFSGLFSHPEYHLYASTWHDDLWSSSDGESWTAGDSAEGAELEMTRTALDRESAQVAYDRYAWQCGSCQYRLSGALFGGSEDLPLAPGALRTAFAIPPGRAFSQLSNSATPTAVWAAPDVRRGSVPSWTQVAPIQDCGVGGAGPCVPLMVFTDAQFGGYLRSLMRDPALYAVVGNQRTGPDGRTLVQSNAGLAFVSNFLFVRDGESLVTPSEVLYPSMGLAGGGQVTIGFNPATGYRRAVYAVDPAFAGHILTPDVASGQMVETFDGGDIWRPMPALTNLVTNAGRFVFSVTNDPAATELWPLVSAISFFPEDPNMIILGTMNAGIFFSRDAGRHWTFVPGSPQIPAITRFHWKSANSVIVASGGRGLWEVEIELRQPMVGLLPACPDCAFLSRVDVPLNAQAKDGKAQSGKAQKSKDGPRDPTLLVMEGHVNGLVPGQDGELNVSVTPGSSRVWFGHDEAKSPVDLVEQTQANGFPGLPEADQLVQQGFFIRGFSFKKGTITGILYGKGEASLPPVNFVEFTKLPGRRSLGLNERPYLTFLGLGQGGLSIPEGEKLTVRGQSFPFASVSLLIDDQVIAGGIQVDQNGGFEMTFPVNVAQGVHIVLATQGQTQGQMQDKTQEGVRVAMPLRVVHLDPADKK